MEALQRRQETIERDLTAIEGKLREHDGEARRLTQKYADMAATIQSKLASAQEHWNKLTSLSAARREVNPFFSTVFRRSINIFSIH